jgi:hypothetical protein
MSKVDDVFDFADELVDEWGQQIQFVVKAEPQYDMETGETTEQLTNYDIKAVITKLDQREIGGLYQANDVKIIFDPVQVGYIYPTEADYFIVPRETAPNEYMKIIQCNTYRGDRPVAYVIIARPQ